MRQHPILVLAAAALLILAGCDDDALAPGDRGPALCSGTIALAASGGATPTISWTPACGISSLAVRPATALGLTEQPVWSFGTPMNGTVGPGVRYGVVPAGATGGPDQAPALSRGTRYRVDVLSLVGGDGLVASGTVEFTAQ